MQPYDFIGMIADEARELQKVDGIFASVVLAQACLETGYGMSHPVDKYTGQESYNLFGIKGIGSAGSVLCQTWEVYNGIRVIIDAKFRAYHNHFESLQDHNLLLTYPRYAPVRNAKDGAAAAMQLHPCGYATDPDYGTKLVSIQRKFNLYQYDTPLDKLYNVYQGKTFIADFASYASAVEEAKKWDNSYVSKINGGAWVWSNIVIEKSEDDDEPMKLEQWQTDVLVNGIKHLSTIKDAKGELLINSPDYWLQKVKDGTLKSSELSVLNFAIASRTIK
jgi:hypothetical protein